MTYDAFLEQMKKDLESDFAMALPKKYSGVKIGIRDVEKVQGESYRGISFKNGNSPVEGNLNMQLAYEAHEGGRSFTDILHETEQAIMQQVDRIPQFDLGVMSDYQAMKQKLMTELIPQKGNEEKLVEEGEDLGGLLNVAVHIGSGLHQNVNVGGQSCRLIQNQHQAGSAFEAEGHSDTFDRFQQAEGIQGPLYQARIGDVFLLQFPDVIKLVNSFVDHLSSSRTMRVSS